MKFTTINFKDLKALFNQFITDKDGNLKVIQLPSPLLWTWIIILLINNFIHSPQTVILQNMVLFAWALFEIKDGESNFRKTLGMIILTIIIIPLYF